MFSESTKGTTKPPELEMTPMIDIVFQLLVFFVMTFRITALEGDFNIKMPIQSNEPSVEDVLNQPIVVALRSGDNRNLASIQIDDQAPMTEADMLERLAAYVAERAQQAQDPASEDELTVEFVIDYDLRYSATVQAVTAVTGKKNAAGVTEQYVDSIKFRDQGARSDN